MSRRIDLLAEDAANRRRALEAGCFIVEAPAGAGKTELLAQRFLRLLAEVEAPEEIVALTFTHKAAGEMRQRIMDTLAAAAAGREPAAAHQGIGYALARTALAVSAERGWELLAQPGRLRITTFDAFCAGLTRQMPVLSRFGGEPRLAENAERHYVEAARRALAWLEEAGALADAVAEALAYMDNDVSRLSNLLVAMLARRDQWLRHALDRDVVDYAEQALAAWVGAELRPLGEQFPASLQRRLMPLARYAASNLGDDHPLAALRDWQAPLPPQGDALPAWRALASLLLTGQGSRRLKVDVRLGFPATPEAKPHKQAFLDVLAELPEAALAGLADVRDLPWPRYGGEERRAIAAFAALLRLAAAQLWTVFQECGEVDFVEVAMRARQSLGTDEQPTDLALALDYRIRHLLVDEFQDTSPGQVELLERLTAGWSPGDGRSVFLVGDPMQSIYRFRKADVGMFLGVAAAGLGGLPVERLHLYRNNRSDAPIVEWLNRTFAQVFPMADRVVSGAIRYRPSAATRAAPVDSGVTGHPLAVADAADAELIEARAILAIVDAEWAEDRQRQIAVLVRARDHLAALLGEIRRHRPELRFLAVEMQRLDQRQPVQDLLALTRALLHRGDRLNWLAILRAPWCGLTLNDLHALVGDDHVATVWRLANDPDRQVRLSTDGRLRLTRWIEVIATALAERGRGPLRRWLEGTWLMLGGPACLADANDLADVQAFLGLVERLDKTGDWSFADLEREVGRLYAAPDAGADGRLVFMTVHKAKGLEFDTVILPGLNRRTAGAETPLLRWEEALAGGENRLLVAPLKSRWRQDDGIPSVYDALGRLERWRSEHEAARLLYVGATRAVRRLHWLASFERTAKGEPKVQPGSLLQRLWPAVSDQFAMVTVDVAAAATADAPPGYLWRLADPPSLVWPTAPAATPIAEPAAAAPAAGLDARTGTLIHAYLELIGRDGPAAWPATRIADALPAMELWLRRRGCSAAEAALGGQWAQAALATTLASEAGRWLLAKRPDAAAELALIRAEGNGWSRHVVDLTFVEAGVRWIVDYKSGRGDAAAEIALSVHVERYREQLQRYADLFQHEGRPIRLAVFFTAHGRLVELV